MQEDCQEVLARDDYRSCLALKIGGTGAASTSGASTGEESTGDSTTGEPLTDCPCEDGADNVCDLAPGTCSATLPGGLCDPDGDGAYFDGDWTLGASEYLAKCG